MGLGQNKYEWVNKLGVPGSIGLGASVGNTAIQDIMVVPFACKLRSVKAIGLGKAGSADPTLDLFKSTASIMSAVMTIAANDTVYSGSLASGTEYTEVASSGGTVLAADDVLSMRAVTGASTGAIITPTLTMKFKSMAPWLGGRFIVIKLSLPGTTTLTTPSLNTVQAMAVLPFDCRPIIIKCAAATVGTGTKVGVETGIASASTSNSLVTNNSSTGVTITSALTGYSGSVVGAPTGINTPTSGKLLSKGTILSLRCYTSASTMTVPSATIVCRY
jgi:hypothetical protein